MSEMVERVARAISEAREYGEGDWLVARAAIDAMREPSEAMVTAGLRAEGHVPEDEANRALQAVAYRAMIDAALKADSPCGSYPAY